MEPYDSKSEHNEHDGIWNKGVYSPVSGIVVATSDDEADIKQGSEEFTSAEGLPLFFEDTSGDAMPKKSSVITIGKP